MHVTRVEFI